MKFNHVDEIWEALEQCKTAEEVYDIIDYIPQKFGTWWADVVGENQLEVTNQWWDKNQEDMIVESQTFEVILEDSKNFTCRDEACGADTLQGPETKCDTEDSDESEFDVLPLEEAKWYRIHFSAKLTPDDLRAMKKCFFDAMNESMEIYDLEGLVIEETKA